MFMVAALCASAGVAAARQTTNQGVRQGRVTQNQGVDPADRLSMAPDDPQSRSIRASQAFGDLHHALSIEIQIERTDPGAEEVWNRGYPIARAASPECAAIYKQSHDLMPSVDAAFRARDYTRANAIDKRASDLLGQADRCTDKIDWNKLFPNTPGGYGGPSGGPGQGRPSNPPQGQGPGQGPNPGPNPGPGPSQPPRYGRPPSPPSGPPGYDALPQPLRDGLARGTCRQDGPNHFSCDPIKPDCSKGAPGAYDPSQNPRCQTYGGGPYRRPSPGYPPASPRPSDPNLAQLKAALIQLDEVLGRAASLQPPLTNKFMTTLAKDLKQDLTFLAQKPYAPARQIAEGLHTGLWKYLTGNAYENNANAVGGVGAALNQTGQLVAQQPEVAAAELTHFLLVAAATGGPGEGAPSAQLAAKAEQSANVLRKLETQVERSGPPRNGSGYTPPLGKPYGPIAGWLQVFYGDIELLLPGEPLKPGLKPLYPVQPYAGGCGQFSCSGVLNKLGVKVNIADLVKQLPYTNTSSQELVDLFAKNGVAARAMAGKSVGQIENWFAQPGATPLIVGIGQDFGPNSVGHWVEISGVSTNSLGRKSFDITDPLGFAYTKPIAHFEPYFKENGGQIIVVKGPAGR